MELYPGLFFKDSVRQFSGFGALRLFGLLYRVPGFRGFRVQGLACGLLGFGGLRIKGFGL